MTLLYGISNSSSYLEIHQTSSVPKHQLFSSNKSYYIFYINKRFCYPNAWSRNPSTLYIYSSVITDIASNSCPFSPPIDTYLVPITHLLCQKSLLHNPFVNVTIYPLTIRTFNSQSINSKLPPPSSCDFFATINQYTQQSHILLTWHQKHILSVAFHYSTHQSAWGKKRFQASFLASELLLIK